MLHDYVTVVTVKDPEEKNLALSKIVCQHLSGQTDTRRKFDVTIGGYSPTCKHEAALTQNTRAVCFISSFAHVLHATPIANNIIIEML
jgi:hypothetical protein